MAQTINNLSETWNAAGTKFTGIKFNVTDTASAAGSLLMDLQVGGSSKIFANKSGVLEATGGLCVGTVFNNPTYRGVFPSGSYAMIIRSGASDYSFGAGGFGAITIPGASANSIGFSIGSKTLGTLWTLPGLHLYSGTNPQYFNSYGTFTDPSNYRRVTFGMSTGGVAEIKPEGAGTGATGNVLHISGLPTSNPGPGILWNNAGVINVGT